MAGTRLCRAKDFRKFRIGLNNMKSLKRFLSLSFLLNSRLIPHLNEQPHQTCSIAHNKNHGEGFHSRQTSNMAWPGGMREAFK